MLFIIADALLIATRQNPYPQPLRQQPKDPEADLANRRRWLNFAGTRL